MKGEEENRNVKSRCPVPFLKEKNWIVSSHGGGFRHSCSTSSSNKEQQFKLFRLIVLITIDYSVFKRIFPSLLYYFVYRGIICIGLIVLLELLVFLVEQFYTWILKVSNTNSLIQEFSDNSTKQTVVILLRLNKKKKKKKDDKCYQKHLLK